VILAMFVRKSVTIEFKIKVMIGGRTTSRDEKEEAYLSIFDNAIFSKPVTHERSMFLRPIFIELILSHRCIAVGKKGYAYEAFLVWHGRFTGDVSA